jgi:HPt (histidine-containing phosphotransfer) domain-containing protein
MTTTESKQQTVDLDAALAKVGGDRALLAELADLFCRERSELLSALERAVADRNGPSAHAAAHSLKGSVAIFSAKRAVALAVQLEASADSGQLASAAELFSELKAEVDLACEELRRNLLPETQQNGDASHPATDRKELS